MKKLPYKILDASMSARISKRGLKELIKSELLKSDLPEPYVNLKKRIESVTLARPCGHLRDRANLKKRIERGAEGAPRQPLADHDESQKED